MDPAIAPQGGRAGLGTWHPLPLSLVLRTRDFPFYLDSRRSKRSKSPGAAERIARTLPSKQPSNPRISGRPNLTVSTGKRDTPRKTAFGPRQRQPGRGHGRSPAGTDDVAVVGVLRRSGSPTPPARRRVRGRHVKAAPGSRATSRHAESVLSHANCQHRARRGCYSCYTC